MNDIAKVRAVFPALVKPLDMGREPVFFDGPGGTQVPQLVIDAVTDYYINYNSNTDGVYLHSQRTDEMIKKARDYAAAFLGAEPEEVAFGQNMTTLNFNLVTSFARTLTAGDEVIVTKLDHDANVSPWLLIAEDFGLKVQFAELDENQQINLDHLRSLVSARTKVIAFTHTSNAVGTVAPIKEIVKIAHDAGALAWLDAVAGAAHQRLNVKDLQVDVLLCSPYKFYGPHLGLAWARKDLIEQMQPNRVRPADLYPVGHRFETGTLTHELMAGFIAGIDYLASLGEGGTLEAKLDSAYEWIHNREEKLTKYFMSRVDEIKGWKLKGPQTSDTALRTGTFGFVLPQGTTNRVAQGLAKAGIYTWDGNFYAQGVIESLNLDLDEGLLRVGLSHYNTEEEIDYFYRISADLID